MSSDLEDKKLVWMMTFASVYATSPAIDCYAEAGARADAAVVGLERVIRAEATRSATVRGTNPPVLAP